jgi:dipeptidase D
VNPYSGLEPAALWRHFAALNAIPRPSGHEDAARQYVRSVAEAAGADWRTDAYGNAIALVAPRRAGDVPVVAVQTHLDMVCEAEPNVAHDCWNDPIQPRLHGDMVYATGTTLGADNGIGVAAALALLTTPDVRHGPLELLFTVDEERGLRGALDLDPSLLSAKFLINLDSEDPDKLINGSAGSQDTVVRLSLVREAVPSSGWSGRRLEVFGLRGGHSGLDIQERLANALKLLGRALADIHKAGIPVSLASLSGGTAHNAIPRFAQAELALPDSSSAQFDEVVESLRRRLRGEWDDAEPGLELNVHSLPTPDAALAPRSFESLVGLLAELPHGVLAMTNGDPPQVKTSCNLARAEVKGADAELSLTSRSFEEDDLDHVQGEIAELAATFHAEAAVSSLYPPWTLHGFGSLLSFATEAYREVNGRAPEIEAIHAGLECGLIAAKVPGMEAISFGPLIRSAHTPSEHLATSTVMPMWLLLLRLLDRLADTGNPSDGA